jgi:hypothetical protein
MAHDKSELETVTLNETSAAPLNETTLPQAANLSGQLLDDRYQIEKELGHGRRRSRLSGARSEAARQARRH